MKRDENYTSKQQCEILDILYNPHEEKAKHLWTNFREDVYYHNRYFISSPLLDFVKQYLKSHHCNVIAGKRYFRARIIDNELLTTKSRMSRYIKQYGVDVVENYFKFNIEDKFWGLDAEESFIPQDNKKVRDGRANPKFIKYLYVAEDEVTALKEVRSLIYDRVNIAEIIAQEDLKIADLDSVNIFEPASDTFENRMLNYIVSAFSSPTANPDDYLPAQVISEYIKSLGYDGVKFPSSLHMDGYNVTIFNHNKCKAISSQQIRVTDYKISVQPILSGDHEHEVTITDNICKSNK